MKRIAVIALTMTIVLATVLTACSSKDGKSEQTANQNSNQQSEKPSSTSSTDSGSVADETKTADSTSGVQAKYDPPLELTTVAFTYNMPLYGNGDDMNNNPWTRYMKDNLGIVVKKLWEVPSEQLEQKTNLMISSGDIPDFFIASPTQLVQLQKAGMIEELTDIYKQYAPDNVKKTIEQAGPEVMEAGTIKGELMGIPFTGFAKENVPIIWIREDWRKKLNLPVPKTMDDLLKISDAFTNGDPDGNGQKDTFGLGLDKSLGMINGFFNGYHAYKSIWLKDKDGGLVYSSIQPEMKNALGKLQEMFKGGQIDPEFGIKESNKVYESMGSNKLGMAYGSITGTLFEQQTPKNRWYPYPAPSIDANPTLVQQDLNINMGFWVVKKGVKHPEAILQMAGEWIKLYYENTRDDIYKQYNYNIETNISPWVNAPVKMYKSIKNAEMSAHLEPFLRSGKEPTDEEMSKLIPEEREVYGRLMDYREGRSDNWAHPSRSELDGGGMIILQYVKNNQMLSDQFFGSPTPAAVQKMANLRKLEDETMTKIILGAPLDEFDKFVENWKKLGGDEITKEVNDWLKNK